MTFFIERSRANKMIQEALEQDRKRIIEVLKGNYAVLPPRNRVQGKPDGPKDTLVIRAADFEAIVRGEVE